MDRLILEKPVHVNGVDFWGRRSSLTLEPIAVPGWFWLVDGCDIPLGPSLLSSEKNHIALSHGAKKLRVFEHLGPLRLAGLDSVRIVTKDEWLPYDGCSDIFWKACAPHLRHDGKLKKYTFAHGTSVCQTTRRLDKSVSVEPGPEDFLKIKVFINYGNLGSHEQQWCMPGVDFKKISRAKTPGWPRWRYYAGWVWATTRGWPHFENVVWPQEHGKMLTKRLFARHRMLDILGALSVLCPPGGVLTGTVHSRCAGHAHDIKLVRQTQIVPVTTSSQLLAAE